MADIADTQKQIQDTIRNGEELIKKALELSDNTRKMAQEIGLDNAVLKRYLASDKVSPEIRDLAQRMSEATRKSLQEGQRQALKEAHSQKHRKRRMNRLV